MDIAPGELVGGVFRLISIRILRGAGSLQGTLPDLRARASAYARTRGTPRWRRLKAGHDGARLPRSPYAELPTTSPPEPLPPGRRRLSASEVSSNQRERILRAGSAAFVGKGYEASTVADIVASARLTRAVFYEHFHGKQELFMEIQQVCFHQLMAISARAFFSAPTWTERVWEGIRAVSDLFAGNPQYAHIGVLESHAAGSESLRHAHDAMMAFTVFLEEGYRQRPEAERLPALCSEAIAGVLIETVYLAARQGHLQRLPEQTPGVVYLALAPFLGPESAGEFVAGKLREASATTPRRRPAAPSAAA
ncbi:MAG TPA: TetR/AcrR family transcriptional regulator [Solirubrobacteraceae bacterium]|jgi:AcrR family transcriptional regulator|nr:TetR/AcrR family transcriptional regulator [Solirubrobacteraceae bacterium]